MLSRNLLVATALLPLTLAAPCGAPDYLVRWTSKIVSSVGWLEGSVSAPEQLIVPAVRDDSTIYDILRGRSEFSQLVQIIDKVDDVKKLLNDKEISVTLFAPDDEAIRKVTPHHHQHFVDFFDDKDDKRQKDREEWLRQSLKYAILPEAVKNEDFGNNHTRASSLHAHDGSIGGHRRRVKFEVSQFPPFEATINDYVKIQERDIQASNGIIHKIDWPLFLPPDIQDGLFILPQEFSLTNSGLFKLQLQRQLEYNAYANPKKGKNDRDGKGTPATTFFAPTNKAWEKLPKDLLLFLFSPYGESTLRKILDFHTIPGHLVFSEWGVDVDDDDDKKKSLLDKDDLSFEFDHHFPTLIDQKLPVHVKKTKGFYRGYKIELQAHGLYASNVDIVGQNGVWHVLDDVVSPRSKEGTDGWQNTKDWNEWKDWLIDWSKERKELD